MVREKYPEKIPFRLTRMLINAMEVSGIEGSFRITCENVMRVIRTHRESLMAVLEAFVYDPLINWRLMPRTKTEESVIDVSSSFELSLSSSGSSPGTSYERTARVAESCMHQIFAFNELTCKQLYIPMKCEMNAHLQSSAALRRNSAVETLATTLLWTFQRKCKCLLTKPPMQKICVNAMWVGVRSGKKKMK
jgi:hypothetical protein